jgi:hypothetical protein
MLRGGWPGRNWTGCRRGERREEGDGVRRRDETECLTIRRGTWPGRHGTGCRRYKYIAKKSTCSNIIYKKQKVLSF